MQHNASVVFRLTGLTGQKFHKGSQEQLSGNEPILKINVAFFHDLFQAFNIHRTSSFHRYISTENFFFSALSL